jgi:hypothetical protein
MPFLVLHVVLSFLLDLAHVLTRGEQEQALELLLLRQQLRLYERKARQPRPSRYEKVVLATLAARLPGLSRVSLVFTPATLLRWHREIVRCTWTFDNRPKRGRVMATRLIHGESGMAPGERALSPAGLHDLAARSAARGPRRAAPRRAPAAGPPPPVLSSGRVLLPAYRSARAQAHPGASGSPPWQLPGCGGRRAPQAARR